VWKKMLKEYEPPALEPGTRDELNAFAEHLPSVRPNTFPLFGMRREVDTRYRMLCERS